ncbi:endo alpha-1,4 polygalactosaminidase [Mesorhizobium sp. 1M-11]|uniref:endo alpha-1,4 polygalactosaminidase n=1 Tax=Mesorhizobium sp. 1M-11 TaxID=1529006 RepID=UPI0009EC1BA0|nr:endo alpha-1,4 polygalactosaminidase [Mesorhizobium sp. 1M-11]
MQSTRTLVAATLILCTGTATAAEQGPGAARGFETLPSDAIADYQLGGAYNPPARTNVVVRDSTAAPVRGLYNICYVNGFQTQPGIAWPPELLVKNSKGKPLVDPDWPDEHLLDISSEKLRAAVLKRLATTISGCARSGFNAVEFDNLDSFTRSKGALRHEDAVAFATSLVRAAHNVGLAAGQKNTPQLSDRERRRIGFDFAVSEECHRYDECSKYTRFYGDRVINIEYVDDLRGRFADICADAATPRDTVLRDRDLKPAQHGGYHHDHCVEHRSVRQ